jgi:hypothetical protein
MCRSSRLEDAMRNDDLSNHQTKLRFMGKEQLRTAPTHNHMNIDNRLGESVPALPFPA